MRLLSIFTLLLFTFSAFSQNVNTTFRSKTTYTGQQLANIWGYAANGKEYALIGAKNGTIITDVTNPNAPVQITQITGPSSSWREIKTYQNYAYVATEGGGGLQIINLAPLPSANLTVTTYTGGGTTPGVLSSIHALQVDEAKGFLYLYGSNLVGGRACVFDLNINPAAPVYKGYYNPVGYAHDGYANNDTLYIGHINAGKFSIVDMTVKTGPNNQIGVTLCPPVTTPLAFTHNTWRYGNTLFTTDEKPNSTLASYDITNLSDIKLLDQIKSNPTSTAIVHNTYIKNGYAITSWYVDGFTITDVSRPDNMVKVGQYDTYTNTQTGFNGAWGVYPYLPSGNILVSNINGTTNSAGEMWVITPNYQRGCYVEGVVKDAATGLTIVNATAQLVGTGTSEVTNTNGIYKMGQLQSGTYSLRITKAGYKPFIQTVVLANGVLTAVNANLTPGTCTEATINSQNFESGLGIWTDGGTHCIPTNDAAFSNTPTNSIMLRSRGGTATMTSARLNLATHQSVLVSFSYQTAGFNLATDDFWLQVNRGDGAGYVTVADFDFGVHFTNGQRSFASVNISGPITNKMRFRFRCDAANTGDQVYIDDVIITGCLSPTQNDFELPSENREESNTALESNILVSPNPAIQTLGVQFESEVAEAAVFALISMTGQVVLTEKASAVNGVNAIQLDVANLPRGQYILSVRRGETHFTQKVLLVE